MEGVALCGMSLLFVFALVVGFHESDPSGVPSAASNERITILRPTGSLLRSYARNGAPSVICL